MRNEVLVCESANSHGCPQEPFGILIRLPHFTTRGNRSYLVNNHQFTSTGTIGVGWLLNTYVLAEDGGGGRVARESHLSN